MVGTMRGVLAASIALVLCTADSGGRDARATPRFLDPEREALDSLRQALPRTAARDRSALAHARRRLRRTSSTLSELCGDVGRAARGLERRFEGGSAPLAVLDSALARLDAQVRLDRDGLLGDPLLLPTTHQDWWNVVHTAADLVDESLELAAGSGTRSERAANLERGAAIAADARQVLRDGYREGPRDYVNHLSFGAYADLAWLSDALDLRLVGPGDTLRIEARKWLNPLVSPDVTFTLDVPGFVGEGAYSIPAGAGGYLSPLTTGYGDTIRTGTLFIDEWDPGTGWIQGRFDMMLRGFAIVSYEWTARGGAFEGYLERAE